MLERYLEELRNELDERDAKDSEEILSYFEEIINDHLDNGESEEEIIASLGNAQDLADSICEKRSSERKKDLAPHMERRNFYDISKVDIEVKSYDVTIEPTKEGHGWLEYDQSDEACLEIGIDGDELSIEEEASGNIIDTFFVKMFSMAGRNLNEHLHIFLPEDRMVDLDLDDVSGDVKIEGIKCDELDLQTVSGDMKLSSVFARDLQIQTVSGDIEAEDITVIGGLDVESVSGDLNGRNVKCDEISVESVSGDVRLFIDGDKEDYEIREESISRHKVYEGSGSKSLSIETVSGDISCRFSGE
ncbi:MAG: DUF4097 family beta strand repeat-containing protein [Erysipelotrichaceae bacterium]|nr:DUF4097 family beta strand repeat-containing protein [Erysipelotrichaceae bacterium]